jgi:hypothetical protein
VLGGEAPRQPYSSMIADDSWSAAKIAGELGDVILGKVPPRQNENETVVFESVGMPIWDTVTTAWALSLGGGEWRGCEVFVGVRKAEVRGRRSEACNPTADFSLLAAHFTTHGLLNFGK